MHRSGRPRHLLTIHLALERPPGRVEARRAQWTHPTCADASRRRRQCRGSKCEGKSVSGPSPPHERLVPTLSPARHQRVHLHESPPARSQGRNGRTPATPCSRVEPRSAPHPHRRNRFPARLVATLYIYQSDLNLIANPRFRRARPQARTVNYVYRIGGARIRAGTPSGHRQASPSADHVIQGSTMLPGTLLVQYWASRGPARPERYKAYTKRLMSRRYATWRRRRLLCLWRICLWRARSASLHLGRREDVVGADPGRRLRRRWRQLCCRARRYRRHIVKLGAPR